MKSEDPDIELCVVGCLLDGGDKTVREFADQLRLDLFWRPDCRKAVEIILSREMDGKTTDVMLLNQEWKNRLGESCPVAILDSPNHIEVVERLPDYLRELVDRYQVSRSKDMLGKLVNKSNHVLLKAGEYKAELDAIFEIAELNPYPVFNAKAAALAMTDDLQRRFELNGKKSGVVTGFPRLDSYLDGLQYAELTIMGARPSHGKSAFALNVAHCAVVYQEIPTLFVTLEMSVPALMRRLLSSTRSIPMQTLKTGQMSQQQFNHATSFNAAISKKPLYFLDAIRGIKCSALLHKIRFFCEEHQVKLVVIDYLQKVKPDTRHEKRTYEVASVSEALKASAVSTGAAHFVLAQMNREPEKDTKKRMPRLSDLADSAQIERDADAVLLLQRNKDSDQAIIVVAKQRDGQIGIIDFTFEGEYVRFQENHETP